ncbi:hypothetical protein R6Q59_013495 [Mikania micrantha]
MIYLCAEANNHVLPILLGNLFYKNVYFLYKFFKASSSMRLSGHQVSLVLSSIWIQTTSMENKPESFEAMGHTFTLALSFILSKNSSHVSLLRFFQLAFSLRAWLESR